MQILLKKVTGSNKFIVDFDNDLLFSQFLSPILIIFLGSSNDSNL